MHVCVCVFVYRFVCPSLRLSITSVLMWCNMDSTWLVKQFFSCYTAAVAIINDGRGLSVEDLVVV